MAIHHFFQRSICPLPALLGLLLLSLMGYTGSLIAQTSSTAFPAAMYRRAAEAAQSQSSEHAYFVALSREHPYEVLSIARELRAVTEAAARTKLPYGIIGPIVGGQPMALMAGALPCKHRPDSYLSCPDTTLRISNQSLERILIIYQTANASDTVMGFSPDSGDAVFFTPSAMEKFVWPYYERIFGMETANRMRQEYLNRYRGR